MRNLVFCYHAVSVDWDAALSVRPDMFERHLRMVLRRGYRPARFAEIVAARGDEGLFAITFDDAFRSVYTLALPILERHQAMATLFVPTTPVDGGAPLAWDGVGHWLDTRFRAELTPMSWSEIGELVERGWEIGSHTCTHPRLTQCDDATLATELGRSRAVCEERLSTPCSSIAYPYGDHDDRVATAVRAAGYRAAAALPGTLRSRDPLRWPRIGVYHVDDERRFGLKISPLVERLRSSALVGALQAARPRAADRAGR